MTSSPGGSSLTGRPRAAPPAQLCPTSYLRNPATANLITRMERYCYMSCLRTTPCHRCMHDSLRVDRYAGCQRLTCEYRRCLDLAVPEDRLGDQFRPSHRGVVIDAWHPYQLAAGNPRGGCL